MGFVAPSLIPAYPPGHAPVGTGVGVGAAGGHVSPPWVNAQTPHPAHRAFAGVQVLNSQNRHHPQPGCIYHNYDHHNGQTAYNG
eukprot:1176488-Karenia_brevis.AAC.1